MAHAATVGWVIAGGLLLVTATTRWFRTGPGSRFGGLELADSVRSGVLSPSWGIWVAAVIYSIVAMGGGFIATAAVRRRVVIVVRAVVSVGGLVAFGLFAIRVMPVSNWSSGPTLASVSFALAVVLSATQLLTSPRT